MEPKIILKNKRNETVLPYEIIRKIFKYFTFSDNVNMREVSKGFKVLAENELKTTKTLIVHSCFSKCKILKFALKFCPFLKKINLTCSTDLDPCQCLNDVLKKYKSLESIGMIPCSVIKNFKGDISNLKELSVSIINQSEIFSISEKCKKIEVLEIDGNNYEEEDIKIDCIAEKCSNLRSLSIWALNIYPEDLKKAKNLTELFFYQTNSNDLFIDRLADILNKKPIKRLKISGKRCTINSIVYLAVNCQNLFELNISYTSIRANKLVELFKGKNKKGNFFVFRKLKTLSVQWECIEYVRNKLKGVRDGLVITFDPWCSKGN